MNYFEKFIPALFLLVAASACQPEKPADSKQAVETAQEQKPAKAVPEIAYTVIKKYPHDVTSFTEGFLFHDNQLFESSGAPEYLPEAKSSFGIVDLKTGKLDVKGEIDKRTYFGEGIVFINGKICQLTYTNQVGFEYDAKTYQKVGQFSFQNKQGWGLTTEGKNLIMSDGTNYLTYFDPKDYHIVKVLGVTENGFALDYINELELINGYIYANVWMKNDIVKIDTASGEVVGKINLDEIYNEVKKSSPNSFETNGIAYDPATDRVLITGKMWPNIYEIKFAH